MILAGIINIFLYYLMRKQKRYYQAIIDSSTNMFVIRDSKSIIYVNEIFFQYFHKFSSLEDFKLNHCCISDLFVKEDGYLYKEVDGYSWLEYLDINKDKISKVKIEYEGKIFYFIVTYSLVQDNKGYFSIVFSDITNEENYKKRLEILNITDALTGVKNRRFFQQKMQEEISRSIRYEHHLSLIMFDIDFFKKVNDTHGHGIGDQVLIEYCRLIGKLLREGDTFCRIGGEEFIIILPHAKKDDAVKLANKLRENVQNHKIPIPITMSFGVVEYKNGDTQEMILSRVDEALYEAKETGRNKVVSR
jgi:diguanylate cyclase (GGDEF)-like protein